MLLPIKEVKGVKVDSYDNIAVFEGFPQFFYEILPARLSAEEEQLYRSLKAIIMGTRSIDEIRAEHPSFLSREFIDYFRQEIINVISYAGLLTKLPEHEQFEELRRTVVDAFKRFFPFVKDRDGLAMKLLDDTIGYGFIAPLLRDEKLEDIMINGYNLPVFVFHKDFGMCKTNIAVGKGREVEVLIKKIAATVNKPFGVDRPLLDARLVSGDRANATSQLLTPAGPSLTIRKFKKKPLSVIDLIMNKTLTSELAAFLWVMVEGLNIEPMNIIVTGGTGSGKTTTLNVLSSFIRQQDRIITIEDTPELQLGSRENWIQMESKIKTKDYEEVTMDDLLKNALRMRPDRIIVGEVRGPEAQTMFVAMDTGHKGTMGTLHSNSSKEMILRLEAAPMNVPEALIPLLDLIVVQYKIYMRGKGTMRRISQVAELTSMGGKPLLSNIYEFSRDKDRIEKTDIPSHVIETLADKISKTKNEIKREMNVRRRIIEWMLRNDIRDASEVDTIIQLYYYSPNDILEKVAAELEASSE